MKKDFNQFLPTVPHTQKTFNKNNFYKFTTQCKEQNKKFQNAKTSAQYNYSDKMFSKSVNIFCNTYKPKKSLIAIPITTMITQSAGKQLSSHLYCLLLHPFFLLGNYACFLPLAGMKNFLHQNKKYNFHLTSLNQAKPNLFSSTMLPRIHK